MYGLLNWRNFWRGDRRDLDEGRVLLTTSAGVRVTLKALQTFILGGYGKDIITFKNIFLGVHEGRRP
jgi:hypothetical protein